MERPRDPERRLSATTRMVTTFGPDGDEGEEGARERKRSICIVEDFDGDISMEDEAKDLEEEEDRFLLEAPRSPRGSSPRGTPRGSPRGSLHSIGGGGNSRSNSPSRNNSGCSGGSGASAISWASLQALRLVAARARSASHDEGAPGGSNTGGGTGTPSGAAVGGVASTSTSIALNDDHHRQQAVYEYSLMLNEEPTEWVPPAAPAPPSPPRALPIPVPGCKEGQLFHLVIHARLIYQELHNGALERALD